jgi:hypothetical protein
MQQWIHDYRKKAKEYVLQRKWDVETTITQKGQEPVFHAHMIGGCNLSLWSALAIAVTVCALTAGSRISKKR